LFSVISGMSLKEYRKAYRKAENTKYGGLITRGQIALSSKDQSEKEMAELAKELLNKNYLPASILGAKLYEKIGQGEKAVSGLVNATDKAVKNEGFDEKDYNEITRFIEEHTEGKYTLGTGFDDDGRSVAVLADKETGLVKKLGIFLGLLAGGFGLSMFSLNLTGNVAGSLAQPKSIVGIILLILGVVGSFFYFKRR